MLIPAGKFYVNTDQVRDVLPMDARMIVIRWTDGTETPYRCAAAEFVEAWNEKFVRNLDVNEVEAIRREYIAPRRHRFSLNPEKFA